MANFVLLEEPLFPSYVNVVIRADTPEIVRLNKPLQDILEVPCLYGRVRRTKAGSYFLSAVYELPPSMTWKQVYDRLKQSYPTEMEQGMLTLRFHGDLILQKDQKYFISFLNVLWINWNCSERNTKPVFGIPEAEQRNQSAGYGFGSGGSNYARLSDGSSANANRGGSTVQRPTAAKRGRAAAQESSSVANGGTWRRSTSKTEQNTVAEPCKKVRGANPTDLISACSISGDKPSEYGVGKKPAPRKRKNEGGSAAPKRVTFNVGAGANGKAVECGIQVLESGTLPAAEPKKEFGQVQGCVLGNGGQ